MSFSSFQLHPQVAAGVQALGYVSPTPIQAQSIPSVLQGRDVLGLAQTGTGKTAAFALPILQRLLRGPRGRLRALVVAPTRELAEQICEAFRDLGRRTRLRTMTLYGGVGMNPQIAKLRAGTEIVVACPGRLLDHVGRGTIKLSGVEVVVLDEADRMFDMGFLPDIRRILERLPTARQTLLFSATMPDGIRRLVHDVLRDPVTVQVDRMAPATTVAHSLFPVQQHRKTALLQELLSHTDSDSVLVFTRTKHRAKRVAETLAKSGFRATSLQGNLSQSQRQGALEGFRNGTFQVLVATDIASRGIDVLSISHVINYDMPDTVDAYTHRIGRTGRAAKTGDAFTLVTPEDRALVRAIEKGLATQIERRTVPGFDYNTAPPRRSVEFSRPPRQAQTRGNPGAKRPRPQTSASSSPASAGTSRSSTAQHMPGKPTAQRFRPRHRSR